LVEKRTVEPQPGLDAPKEEVWRYSWNGAGLLQKATRHDGLIVECTYDPFARRLEKKVLHQSSKLLPPTLQARTRFVWDGDVLVHEIREAGLEKGDPVVEERTYWFEDDGFEPLAHREKRVDDVGRERGGWFHYVNDPIGTPDRLLAEDGSIATEYERKAWGQLEPKSGAKATTPIRLQGQYWDEETGLAYNRWRYYDGEGRFVSADPLGPPGGFNENAWDRNSTRWIDPLGLSVADKLGKAMTDAGRPLKPGQTPHHMVPREGGGASGKAMRALLKRNGIDIDDAANGAALWGTNPSQVAQPGHPGRDCAGYHGGKVHSRAAYKKLQGELEAAEKRGGADAVKRQLGNARGRMENGRWNP
jgi:RHS repeat-associated protein